MKTNYKINKDDLILNIKFLYDVGFNKDSDDDIIKYVNKVFKRNKIKFNGKRILVYINGILLGYLYLTNYYLKKLKFKNTYLEFSKFNTYFERLEIMEIEYQKN